jgi:pimeloyl-ACP methyl ester carboxylesterase
VRELVAEGYRVVAFDAPAHGDSPGRHTYLIDWVDGLRALQWRYGRFHAVIGHSFGGLGALVAVADDVVADRLVAVAAPSGADTLLSQFQRTLGYPDSTAAALRRRFAERYFPGEDDPFARLSATGRPLPAGTAALLVHDAGDRAVPFPELARLRRALTGARVIETRGFGHNRVLGADAFLDGVLEFLETPRRRSQGAAPHSTMDTTAA